jgi:hypothetical protein
MMLALTLVARCTEALLNFCSCGTIWTRRRLRLRKIDCVESDAADRVCCILVDGSLGP